MRDRDTPIDVKRSATEWLSDHTVDLIEWIGLPLSGWIFYRLWKHPPVQFIPHTWFALLATLPGILGLLNHFLTVLPRFQSVRKTVEDYQAFCRGFDIWWLKEGWPRKLAETGYTELVTKSPKIEVNRRSSAGGNLASYRPPTIIAIWAALILTLVFEVAAGVADGRGIASRIIGINHFAGFPLLLVTWTAKSRPISFDIAVLDGFLFAALGAFVSVMWRMINRIHANALTVRFMFAAALRSAIAMIIGLTAGKVNLFGIKDQPALQGTLFFLAGLFTDWALTMLRARARTVFNQPDAPCDRLPLCYVDGLDDGVIDILDEIGIWDVQHLATSEPGELAVRTLYPFNRIIDWIDQAILISYFRRDIVEARKVGITGAIDLATLFSYTLEQPTAEMSTENNPELNGNTNKAANIAARADALLDELSKKMSMSREAIELICSNLYLDYTVEQLYRFWQHHRYEITATTPGPAAP